MDRRRIMVVDDEQDILRVIELALQKEGLTADVFSDPVKAFKHFSNHFNDYGLIISDIRMVDINGWELVAVCQSINDRVQVIIISAFLTELASPKGRLSKDDILEKPFKISDLIKKVREKLAIPA